MEKSKMIKISNVPQWHEFAPGVKLHIARLTVKVINSIVKEADGDNQKRNELLADHLLLDWEGLVDDNNNALPVTLANKLAVMNNCILSDFIDDKAAGLQFVDEKEVIE